MRYFRIKEWATYQHYKDRNPPWIKLHREMLSSRTWVMLDDDKKALAVACMLLAAINENKVPCDPEYIQRVAYLKKKPDLSPLVETGFIEIIEENVNSQAQSSERLQMLANDTERSPEAEQSREEQTGNRPSGLPDCPHDEIIAAYHETLPTCPKVRAWTDKRRAYLRSRWRENAKHYATVEEGIAWWRKFFGYVAESQFLTGRSPPSRDRPPFVADLEWLVTPSNFVKVLEGKYHA